ncbi:MAG: transglutaminase domain-containing protein, partial [Lachnospiraceae bacterium]|nr:transglutaminase domain-containing protein [Lachnospiraceae bacterium]
FASVDYSNSKDGYIMVEYFGSSPKVKLQILGPNGVTYTYDIQTGQAAFPLTSGAGAYEISVCENIEGTSYSLAYKGTINVPEVSEFGPYLHPNQYVYFNSSCQTVAKGAELAASCTNELDVVTNVYNYITKNITYDYDKANNVKSGYISNVDEILRSGTGICLDYSAVMTSMLRTQRIPTRLEVGYVGKDMVYHAWISVYITDVGWLNGIIQFDGKQWSLVDPTFGASTDSNTLKEYIGDGTNYATKYVY